MTKSSQAAHAASDKSTNGGGRARSDLPVFPNFNPADIERFFQAHQAMVQNMLEVNRGLFDFVDSRLKADVATFDDLCKCKDWQEVSKVQNRFMNGMTQQYFEQTMKLMDAAAKMLAAQRAAIRE